MKIETDHLDFIKVNEFNRAITMAKTIVKKYNNSIYFYHNGFNLSKLPENSPKFFYNQSDFNNKDYLIIGLHLFKKDLCVIVANVANNEILYDKSIVELYARDIVDETQFLSLFKHFFKLEKII